jgi:hypothetical protein
MSIISRLIQLKRNNEGKYALCVFIFILTLYGIVGGIEERDREAGQTIISGVHQ